MKVTAVIKPNVTKAANAMKTRINVITHRVTSVPPRLPLAALIIIFASAMQPVAARDPFTAPAAAIASTRRLPLPGTVEPATIRSGASSAPRAVGTLQNGSVRYTLTQTGDSVSRVALKKPARSKQMSLSVRHIDLRGLLQTVAHFMQINIITGDSIKGTVTADLNDLSWSQALDVILQSKGLVSRKIGKVLWIASQEELAKRSRLEQTLEIEGQHEVLQGELFQLNYQKAETLRKLLHIGDDGRSKPNVGSSLLSARGSAIVDVRTNQLLITDTAAALERVRVLIRKIDIASRQVLIQAYIVEANHQFSRNLGVRLGFATGNHGATTLSANAGPQGGGSNSTDAGSFGSATQPNMGAMDLPAAALGGMQAGRLALSLFNPVAGRFLSLELSALEADGKGRIISNPRVVTADQQAALIEQGEEIPYQQAAGLNATSTSFKKANLKLQVTPQITPDDQIILTVDINKDSRGAATPGGLAINTKHIKTQVQVENDGTVVIGGIYTETVSDTETKVPLLGDLPVLGNLFKNTGKLRDKTELLIFLTPKIVGSNSSVP
jgi:type IV pilus assembly protein PilQ